MSKFVRGALIAAVFVGNSFLIADPEPYASIRQVSYEPYYFENSWILLDKVNAQSTTVFIDIESVDGMAARFVSANVPADVKVYNVNPWSQDEHQFQQFLSNVIEEGQQEQIIPLRMSSKEGSATLNLAAEVIYIDCSQPDSVYEKILSWSTHLTENGLIVGNYWNWNEVKLPVVSAAGDLGLTFSTNANFWFLKREGTVE